MDTSLRTDFPGSNVTPSRHIFFFYIINFVVVVIVFVVVVIVVVVIVVVVKMLTRSSIPWLRLALCPLMHQVRLGLPENKDKRLLSTIFLHIRHIA